MTTAHGTVTRDGAHGTIHFERVLGHPVDKVWEAITTPDGLAGWWLPFPATITVDLTVGGAFSFSAPELGEAPMTCEIVEVEAPHRLVYKHFSPGTTMTWQLDPEGAGCRLRLTEDTPDISAAMAEGHIVGLHHSLDRLDPALAGAPEPWDWDRLPVIEAKYRELLATPRQRVVDRYVDGFRTGDHAAILACLTDDVTWDIVGHAMASGSTEFEKLIDGPPGSSLPRLSVERHVEGTDLVATFGTGGFDDADGTTHSFRFADAFTFRGDLICAVVSYVVPI